MSRQKKKQGNPVRVVTILAVVLVLLTVGCIVGKNYISNYNATRLAKLQEEAEKTNQQLEEDYQVAVAEYEAESSGSANLAWPSHASEGWDVIDLTNYPLENAGQITVSRADVMNNGMLLVNQWHSRPDDFSEELLESVGTRTNGAVQVNNYSLKLFPEAIDALQTAITAASAEGYEHYMVAEGYRSWDDQNTLFTNQMAKLESKYSGDELIEQTKKSVNYPGTSEYNTGLSFRLRLYDKNDSAVSNATFSTSDQGKWFNEHCWEYGLVFRFQLEDFPMTGCTDKSYKTGISTKMNLYRYVGEGNAAVMHIKDFCLEEYIEYLAEHPHIAVFEDGVLKYEIYREYVGDSDTFQVSIAGKASSYSTSLDNMGCVVTVFYY